ncbi:MFS transporter [Pedobacter duraquae]|uniref:DHA2 family methylenomycin A resistance protein-like MFS transporter n=1 Tax=Pedobacter duraquae TaxID=425511 RepID=A0A4R6IPQ6_9SPHI|nr:MFS transporter [Pedobacter duraquae]TDO24253.1 DHA2 family methylenomycin A resistance protein-like MFS transporter [Pedobacter duraquae]
MTSIKQNSAPSTSFAWIVTITSLAFIIAQLDVSIVNIALPQIVQTYKADISMLQWVVDAYTLAFAVLMLSAGSLSDLLGAKRIFQLGMCIFGIASLGCGFAPNAGSLIGFRVLQGVGAATMIPSSLAILNQAFAHQPATRTRAIGLWTATGSAAIAAGPIVGGILIELSSWRFIFLVNVPLCIAGLLLSFRLQQTDMAKVKKKFDFAGQIAWMLSITTLIASIIEWPQLGLSHPLIYGSLIFSGVTFLLFLAIENKVTAPMLPLHLFKSATFNVLLLLGAILNWAYYGTVFILSLYLQNVLHYPSLHAGFAFLPLTLGFVISNLLSGRIINKFGIRIPILTGLVLFAAGFAGLFIAQADTPYWQLFLPFLVIPMGMGLAVPSMTNGILSSTDKALSGTASAVLNTVRQAAGAIGVAVSGAMAAGNTASLLQAIYTCAAIAILLSILLYTLNFKYLKNSGMSK